MPRKRIKKITVKKIIVKSRPVSILGIRNVRTLVPVLGMITKQTEFKVIV